MVNNENKKAIFVTNGCSNHSKYERAVDDYYSTDPLAIDMHKLLDKDVKYYEVACGDGSLFDNKNPTKDTKLMWLI